MYQPKESLSPRQLADFELVYIIEGQVNYFSDGITHSVPSGGFILGRPGFHETYEWDPHVPTRHAYFHFDIEMYPSDWPKIENWPRVRLELSPVCVSLFRHILQHIYEHNEWPVTRPKQHDCRLVETLLDTFMEDQHAEQTSFERDRPEPVRRALIWIRRILEEDPHRTLTLAEMAEQANVTEKHLCRLFSRSLGRSPMQTYTLLKLQMARPLLIRSNLNIQEIAERCGFSDPLYFSRRFAQAYGCAPSAFRRELRQGRGILQENTLPVDLTPRIRW